MLSAVKWHPDSVASDQGEGQITGNCVTGQVNIQGRQATPLLRSMLFCVRVQPSGLSLSADGRELWVADSESSTVRSMDLASGGGRVIHFAKQTILLSPNACMCQSAHPYSWLDWQSASAKHQTVVPEAVQAIRTPALALLATPYR